MITPFKHAFYIELSSLLLVGRRLIDLNAFPTALDHWKRSSVSRMKIYRDYVDHFKKVSIKPYLDDWNVQLNNHAQCSAWYIPDLLECLVKCHGTAYCQVSTNIQNIKYYKGSECVCDMDTWPLPPSPNCNGLCFCKFH